MIYEVMNPNLLVLLSVSATIGGYLRHATQELARCSTSSVEATIIDLIDDCCFISTYGV